jgi:NAD(P)-dependent dehydrogenase (short-subunit alcohol dehydrogenase family)
VAVGGAERWREEHAVGELRGKTALVTGAASGIGRATATALAEAGARLVVCDVNEDGLAEVARALGSSCLLSRRVDVSKREEMRAFADAVHDEIPAVDVLVNNAGVGLAGGILDTSLEDWEWILSINLWGVIHGCHFFVPKMVERAKERKTRGNVVNVSSALGYFAAADVIGYATSKFGVLGLSESLRAELDPHGIAVSVICPGVIATGIINASRFSAGDTEATRAKVDAMYKKRNYGPEKVARAIVDAVRRDGQVVPVSPEAWALYYVKRFAPRLGMPLGKLLARRSLGGGRG